MDYHTSPDQGLARISCRANGTGGRPGYVDNPSKQRRTPSMNKSSGAPLIRHGGAAECASRPGRRRTKTLFAAAVVVQEPVTQGSGARFVLTRPRHHVVSPTLRRIVVCLGIVVVTRSANSSRSRVMRRADERQPPSYPARAYS